MPIARTPLIQIRQGVARHPLYRLRAPFDFTLHAGEHTVLFGKNGAGKTLLARQIAGACPLLGEARTDNLASEQHTQGGIRCLSFRDIYGGNEPAYYQQRWNRADEQVFPTVAEMLERAKPVGEEVSEETLRRVEETGITAHLDKTINLLSSGELRRLQTARMLFSRPKVLMIDNPFIGLDREARRSFTALLEELAKDLTLILIVCREADIPPFIRKVVSLSERTLTHTESREEFFQRRENEQKTLTPKPAPLPLPPTASPVPQGENMIEFCDVTVTYGSRHILHHLDWTVRCGERWALTGPNGAGKSTLLSLICADNPQGYACPIHLFGKRRGRGESIWEIKKHIGFVSPEMFSTYRKPLPGIDIAASGLRDTIGLYVRPSQQERELCLEWMERFGAGDLATRDYLSLSDGEQRLVLLVRAFVKQPALLILDEPFHGLDDELTNRARSIIDAYMARPDRTLIMVSHYDEELPSCIDHRLTLSRQD